MKLDGDFAYRRARKRLSKSDLRVMDNDALLNRFSFNGRERNCLFKNLAGKRFVEAGYPLGVDVDLEGRGVAVADLDRDGAQDLVVRSIARRKLTYFHNEVGAKGNVLRVALVGTTSNRDAIGAVARLKVGKRILTRLRSAGSGFQGQSEATLHFGLGSATRAAELEIRWPSGMRQVFRDLRAGELLRIVEGSGRLERAPLRRKAGRESSTEAPNDGRWLAWNLDGQRWRPRAATPVLVNLWATWCKSCRQEFPALNRLRKRLTRSVDMVGISFDESDIGKVEAFLHDAAPTFPIAFSTRTAMRALLASAFGEQPVAIPATILLDAQGDVRRVFRGVTAPTVLERAIAGLRRTP